jgi:N-acetylmuramoyl-L-alanine amidase
MSQAATIIVDTGHTPLEHGVRAPDGQVEYRFNLELSDKLTQALAEKGIAVTRVAADGKEIELQQRSSADPAAHLFVSIHHDSIPQAWIDAGRRGEFAGYALFVSEKNPQYAESLRCARAIGEQLRAAGEMPSLYHATPIPGENRPLIDTRLGIHRFDDLVVLKTAPMAAVLVEAGVIANPAEERRLSQPATQNRIARAIAQGLVNCLNR